MNRPHYIRYALWGLALVATLVLESKMRIASIKPNLLVLFAYFAGLRHGPVKGLFYGAGLGIVADSIAGGMLGPRMFSLGTVGYLSSFLTGRLFTWTPFLGFFAVAILSVADGLLAYGSLVVFSSPPMALGQSAIVIFWQAAMNSLISPCIRPGNEG